MKITRRVLREMIKEEMTSDEEYEIVEIVDDVTEGAEDILPEEPTFDENAPKRFKLPEGECRTEEESLNEDEVVLDVSVGEDGEVDGAKVVSIDDNIVEEAAKRWGKLAGVL